MPRYTIPRDNILGFPQDSSIASSNLILGLCPVLNEVYNMRTELITSPSRGTLIFPGGRLFPIRLGREINKGLGTPGMSIHLLYKRLRDPHLRE